MRNVKRRHRARPVQSPQGYDDARACRRPDRRRRPLRHRRRLPPAGALPGQELRDPRGARRHRRHLGPLPLPGHPLGLRHAHARLPLQALDRREGDRRRPVDPRLRPRDRARGRHRRARSASTTASSRAAWSSADARWTVEAERTDTGETVALTCGFLFMCSGYYRYDEGYTPEFPGIERFGGQVVHPQHWPEDLDYAGKRVVVIGSGATAVTLVPAMAETAAHVTMLQRSPTYVVSLPGRGPDRQRAAPAACPTQAAYAIVRWKNVAPADGRLPAQPPPAGAGEEADPHGRRAARCRPGYDVDTHFKPAATTPGTSACAWSPTATCSGRSRDGTRRGRHRPDRDLHRDAASSSSPGEELEADIIVTATGLNLLFLGGMRARRRRRGGRRLARR